MVKLKKLIFLLILYLFLLSSPLLPQERFKHIHDLISGENYKQAVTELMKIVRKNNKDAEAFNLLGEAYVKLDSPEYRKLADGAFERAVSLDKKNTRYLMNFAIIKTQRGESQVAEYLLKKALSFEPENPKIYKSITKLSLLSDRYRYIPRVERFINISESLKSETRLEIAFLLGKVYLKKRELKKAENLYLNLLEGHSDNPFLQVYLSDVYCLLEMYEEAARYYIKGIESMKDAIELKARYREFSFLLTDNEKEIYSKKPVAEKGKFIAQFWKKQDPNPVTVENERLIEHFKRIRYAKTFYYSRIEPGYDERGMVLVKYGPPDSKFIAPAGSNLIDYESSSNTITRPNESWVYTSIDQDLSFDFTERGGSYFIDDLRKAIVKLAQPGNIGAVFKERADLSMNYARAAYGDVERYFQERFIAEASAPPQKYIPEFPYKDNIDLSLSFAQFRDEAGKTRLEFYQGIYLDDKDFEKKDINYSALYDYEMVIMDSLLDREKTIEEKYEVGLAVLGLGKNTIYRKQKNVLLEKGLKNFGIRIENDKSNRGGVFKGFFRIKDFSGNGLMVSDIQFSDSISTDTVITPGVPVKNDLAIVPYPYNIVIQNQPVYIYFEIYNLAYNNRNKTSYLVEYSVKQKGRAGNILIKGIKGLRDLIQDKEQDVVTTSFERTGESKDTFEYLLLDMRNLDPGIALLTVKIIDRVSGKAAVSEREFELRK